MIYIEYAKKKRLNRIKRMLKLVADGIKALYDERDLGDNKGVVTITFRYKLREGEE